MVTETEASQRLRVLEARHDLLRYRVDGWCAWPLFRFSVAMALMDLPFDKGRRRFTRRDIVRALLRDGVRALVRPRACFAVKTFGSTHTEFVDGKRRDVYFDDLLDALETQGYYKIEGLNSRDIFDSEIKPAIPRDISTFPIEILGRRLRPKVSPDMVATASVIVGAIHKDLGLGRFTVEGVARQLADFVGSKRSHRLLLSWVRPQRLLIADGGDHALIAAARELGIEVIEFQHGFTHRDFPGNSWSAEALPHKAAMPIPDRLFLYGPHWQQELSASGFWGDELKSVGSIRVDKYRAITVPRRDDHYTMVFTAQGIETDRVIQFFSEFVRQARGRIRYRLFMKMHPTYHTNMACYQEAFGNVDEVVVVPGAENPGTFDLLSRAHAHLSISSTCHFEALALGVPTIVLPLPGKEVVHVLANRRHAFYPDSAQDMVRWIHEGGGLPLADSIGQQYFAQGALDNILSEFGKPPGNSRARATFPGA